MKTILISCLALITSLFILSSFIDKEKADMALNLCQSGALILIALTLIYNTK